nr:JAB domain-containing protein [Bradyrhizobium iriomotense]
MSPEVALRFSWRSVVACLRLGVDRTLLASCKNVEIDPKRTSCRPVVLMHNHLGGDPTPSRADIEMTRVIVEIAKQFGIAIQDHIIVGKQGHASLKELKLI